MRIREFRFPVLAALILLAFFSCRSAPSDYLEVSEELDPPAAITDVTDEIDAIDEIEEIHDEDFEGPISEEPFADGVDELDPMPGQLEQLETEEGELPLEDGLPIEEEPPLAIPPPIVQPPVVQAPDVLPPPPVVQPPVVQPPVAAPPIVQPPVVQPPVTQPPVAAPPAVQPPQQERPEPPSPPAFLRPAEQEIVPPAREPPPAPFTPPSAPPDMTLPELAGEAMVFSRTVRAAVGQIVEIPFWGTGWVYLGELGNRRGMNYSSRRLDVEAGVTMGQTFIFIAETAGTYILRFFRQDFIQDYLLHDYVQVIVGERREDTGGLAFPARERVIAEPRWPAAAAQAAELNVDVEAHDFPALPVIPWYADDEITSVITPPTIPPRIESPAEFVNRARQEFNDGRIIQALSILENMRQHHHDTDEALWLRGQLLEADSPARDIRQALEYYQRLVREFPQSVRVPEARRRIVFLERFFFNIR